MLRTITPITIFQSQIERLQALIPGIRDGRLDSIHDARIATRRAREVLPLTPEWQRRHLADNLSSRFKQMGRSLGRVRDSDVRIGLLRHYEARIPLAAPALAGVRQREEAKRLRQMRRLLERFERLSVEEALDRLVTTAPWKRWRIWVSQAGAWRAELRRLLADRAIAAREAVVHATGVYFPNRSHQARIAVKKLRYAAEIATQIGYPIDDALIRDLKKAVDVLGNQHDRQVLLTEFPEPSPEQADQSVDPDQTQLIRQVLQAEIADLHARYLDRRQAVLDAANRVAAGSGRQPLRAGALAVAVVALTGAEYLRRKRKAPRRREADVVTSGDRELPVIPLRLATPSEADSGLRSMSEGVKRWQ